MFDNYSNTIAYLKKIGIYKESTLDVSSVREIKVDNYYPGYDTETMPYSDVDINVETSHASYTDPEQIKELLSVIIESGYYNPWFDYDLLNDQYSVQVYRTGEFSQYSSTYYSILKGKVPQFVKEDTN